MDKDNLEKWKNYLQEEPEYLSKLHELNTRMVKDILLTMQEKDLDLYTLARILNMPLEEIVFYLEFKQESFAIYNWILKKINHWDKEE